jgi:Sulfotransferase family
VPRPPLLVTGSHRSGSTWVGRTLARAPGVVYVEEPFHPGHRPGICRARPSRWYHYVCRENEDQGGWRRALERTLGLRYDLAAELPALGGLRDTGPRDIGRLARDWGRFTLGRWRGGRALMKDPIAFFSTPWIAERFGAQVVVLTRHPAAFASSLKRLDWTFDFGNWLDQPLLVRDQLGPWRAELEAFRAAPGDVIDQAALCWKVIAGVTRRWEEEHPNWHFRTHEQLSREPVNEYRGLFEALGLPFSEAIAQALEVSTRADNPAEAPSGTAHALKRDSRANISNWKTRLDADEVRRLRDGVGEAAEHFYGQEDW